ncbi:MAG: OB-fold nucleic acid binding domain-containing protein, partial [Actinobacteria bacterium]|nr:OB-fold nucleic acid binding domain-containing protein [Actinomycetota bacterium]
EQIHERPPRRMRPGEETVAEHERPAVPPGATPISSLTSYGRATVVGRVRSVEIRPVDHSVVLACRITDATGDLTALFYGRSYIPGLEPGSKIRLRGPVGVRDSGRVMANPAYELLS